MQESRSEMDENEVNRIKEHLCCFLFFVLLKFIGKNTKKIKNKTKLKER
jgi:hypothetical protein